MNEVSLFSPRVVPGSSDTFSGATSCKFGENSLALRLICTVFVLGLELSSFPHDVPTKWKAFNKLERKSGGEGEVTRICLSTNEKTTAVIKVYTHNTKTRKMRAYREITALKILDGKLFLLANFL
jgi:hypothetical protein